MSRDQHSSSPEARRILWNRIWDRILEPPRTEPANPEQVPTPESVDQVVDHSREVGDQ